MLQFLRQSDLLEKTDIGLKVQDALDQFHNNKIHLIDMGSAIKLCDGGRQKYDDDAFRYIYFFNIY